MKGNPRNQVFVSGLSVCKFVFESTHYLFFHRRNISVNKVKN